MGNKRKKGSQTSSGSAAGDLAREESFEKQPSTKILKKKSVELKTTECDHQCTAAAVDTVPVRSDLPPDWIVCKSKRTGGEYYFNTATGESSWEKPNFACPPHRGAPCENHDKKSPKKLTALPNTDNTIDFNFSTQLIELSSKGHNPSPGENLVEMHNLSDGEIIDDSDQCEEPMEVDEVVCQVRKEHNDDLRQRTIAIKSSNNNRWGSANKSVSAMVYIVIDTNIWLRHLDFVRTLKKFRFECSIAVIVVPYVVLQELDFFKDSRKRIAPKNAEDLSRKASAAINFIYSETEANSPYLMCQPSAVDAQDYSGLDCSRGNDDRVLKCALQVRDQTLGRDQSVSLPFLCTNDKVLLIKAEANDLIAGNVQHMDLLLNDIASDPSKYTSEIPVEKTCKRKETTENNKKPSSSSDLSTPDQIFDFARQFLADMINDEFRRVYGKDADSIFIVKPPWPTLKVVIEVILKHWVAVFRYMWTPPDVYCEYFQALYKILIKKIRSAVEDGKALVLIDKLLTPFENRSGHVIRLGLLLKSVRRLLSEDEENDEVVIVSSKAPTTADSKDKCQQKLADCSDNCQQTSANRLDQLSADSQRTKWETADSSDNKQLRKIETACHEIWRIIAEKRTVWTKDLITSWQNKSADHPATTTRLQSLCNVTQHLLDTMDAGFNDNPKACFMRFRQGALRFTHALNSFTKNLFPEDPSCHDLIHVEPSIFESFISLESNRDTFTKAGDYLLDLLIAMKQDLKQYGV